MDGGAGGSEERVLGELHGSTAGVGGLGEGAALADVFKGGLAVDGVDACAGLEV